MSDAKTKKRKTFKVKFTKHELIHLRDLFSVMLPPELRDTLSQRLAQSQDRSVIEALLWQKLVTACEKAKLPMNEDAPDFIVAASGPPPVSVFELSSDPSEPRQTDAEQGGNLFGDDGGDPGEQGRCQDPDCGCKEGQEEGG